MSITSTAASTTLCLSLSTAPLSPSEEDTVGSHSCFFLIFLQSSWSSKGETGTMAVAPGEGGLYSPTYFYR